MSDWSSSDFVPLSSDDECSRSSQQSTSGDETDASDNEHTDPDSDDSSDNEGYENDILLADDGFGEDQDKNHNNGSKRRFPVNGIRARQKQLLEKNIYMSREQFRDRLLELESERDLRLLYPPALWQSQLPPSDTAKGNAHKLLRHAFVIDTNEPDSEEADLYDFCFCHGLGHARFAGQYESLHIIASEQNSREYLVWGRVTYRGQHIFLEGDKVARVSVGGLDASFHSCENEIWVQTEHSLAFNGWYRLQNPAEGYFTFWSDFYWIANFAKYCIDYLTIAQQNKRFVALADFKSDFIQSLDELHGHATTFREWKLRLGTKKDLRRHISQYGSFVYDQCYSAELFMGFQEHLLWADIGCSFIIGAKASQEQTVVTRNTASTFLTSFPQWGSTKFDLLDVVDCSAGVEALRKERKQKLKLQDKFSPSKKENPDVKEEVYLSKVERTLEEARKSNLRVHCPPEDLLEKLVVVRQTDGQEEQFDFAFVTRISNNRKRLRIVWLTLPSDTICVNPRSNQPARFGEKHRLDAYYPIDNELFFSNDCNCFSVDTNDVVGVYDIAVLDSFKNEPCEFFAKMLYDEEDQSFLNVDLAQLLFTCEERCTPLANNRQGTAQDATRLRCLNSRPWTHRTQCGLRLQPKPPSNFSLFTGCGLFDRALESGGKMHTTFSIDSNAFAVCSAKANAATDPNCSEEEFVLDSVNTALRQVMLGERAYPEPDCLSAGCPCPGFSTANYNRSSKNSQRDCTLLVSVLAWIEVILPLYVVIENVPSIDTGSPSACSQAISFLVALGYQVRKIQLKASDFGGSTRRERLFILAAAPSHKLPDCPMSTHGDNDLKQLFTIKMAVGNLEPVHNDTLVNIKNPYHIPLTRLSPYIRTSGPNLRDVLHRIPTRPPGQGLISSQRHMTKAQQEWTKSLHHEKRKKGSQTMRRVEADGLFRTVVTGTHWQCANTGQIIHYDQDRILSLEEVARAQGVPEDFVLIGPIAQKLRQVGNAVPFCLREAIGKEIAKAYQQSPMAEIEAHTDSTSVNAKQHIVTDADDNDDDVVIISSKEEYQSALLKRQKATSSLAAATAQVTTTTTKITASSRLLSARVRAIRSIEQQVNVVHQQQAPRSAESDTITVRTEVSQRSARIQKRSRSTTISNQGDDEEDDQRAVKRRARQIRIERERALIGASAESSDDDEHDNEDLVLSMSRLSSENRKMN